MSHLGLHQELVWDSLCTMFKAFNDERDDHALSIFELGLVDALILDARFNDLSGILGKLKEGLVDAEAFLIHCDSNDSGVVVASTIADELHMRWPLIGPLSRALKGHPSVVYNAKMIPIFKVLPIVHDGRAISMVMRAWKNNTDTFLLVAVHPNIGHFSSGSQKTLDKCAKTLENRAQEIICALVDHKDKAFQGDSESLSGFFDLNKETKIIDKPISLTESSLPAPNAAEETKQDPEKQAISLLNNRYHLHERLGSGGFGTVYKGYDQLIKRTVALKVIKDKNDSKMARNDRYSTFAREATMAASVRHPNIVTIYDLGFDDDKKPYIVMEYLEGIDLQQELSKSGPFSLEKMFKFILPVLDGLGSGHRVGLVHRDLKPSNLFLEKSEDGEGRVRILDFGIAISMADNDPTKNSISGTAKYLAPELIRYKMVTPRLDVYQMGLLIMHLLTGKPPIKKGSFVNVVKDILAGRIERPKKYLNHPLNDVLSRATALDPKERYADALEFKSALAEIRGHV